MEVAIRRSLHQLHETNQLLLYLTRDHENIVFPSPSPHPLYLPLFDMILQGLESILEHEMWSVFVESQTCFRLSLLTIKEAVLRTEFLFNVSTKVRADIFRVYESCGVIPLL